MKTLAIIAVLQTANTVWAITSNAGRFTELFAIFVLGCIYTLLLVKIREEVE